MVSTPGSRRSLISPLAFAGRTAEPAQPDPVTNKLLNQNSLQLGLVASQINSLNRDVVSLNTSLQVISNSLATSQALERQKEQQEQLLESKLAQQQLREGKESVIEKKIEAAAIAPAQKLANRASFSLGKLGTFFLTLIGGWLGSNLVEALQARSEGNTKKLNEIKLEVITGLGIITGVFVASNLALTLLTGSFGRIAILLAGVAAAGLFTQPGRDFIGVIKDAVIDLYNRNISKIPGIGPRLQIPTGENEKKKEIEPTKPPEPGVEPGAEPETKTEIDPSKPPGMNKGGLVEGTSGIDQIAKMLTDGEFVMPDNVVSNYGLDFMESIRAGESLFATNAPDISSSAAQVQPMENVSGEKLDDAEKGGHKDQLDAKLEPTPASDNSKTEPANVPLAGDPSQGLEPGQITPGDTTLADMGFSTKEVQGYIDQENYIGKNGKLPPNMFTPIQKAKTVADKVSQPPAEQPINVIPMPIPPAPSQQAPAPASAPSASGPVGNVPLYATSDSDNMYRLAAVSAFNVPSV
jgi:hypothetical protein